MVGVPTGAPPEVGSRQAGTEVMPVCNRHRVGLDGLTQFSWLHTEDGIICFKGEEAEFREAESLVQGHTAGKWKTESDPRGTLTWIKFYKANRFY